jgi:HlyD family secretion protein
MRPMVRGLLIESANSALDHSGDLRKNSLKLKAGMPAEAFIQTNARTPLSYLLKPLSDQIAHAFREG